MMAMSDGLFDRDKDRRKKRLKNKSRDQWKREQKLNRKRLPAPDKIKSDIQE
jgi:hypothetical protein